MGSSQCAHIGVLWLDLIALLLYGVGRHSTGRFFDRTPFEYYDAKTVRLLYVPHDRDPTPITLPAWTSLETLKYFLTLTSANVKGWELIRTPLGRKDGYEGGPLVWLITLEDLLSPSKTVNFTFDGSDFYDDVYFARIDDDGDRGEPARLLDFPRTDPMNQAVVRIVRNGRPKLGGHLAQYETAPPTGWTIPR